jgi:hypothetical protein
MSTIRLVSTIDNVAFTVSIKNTKDITILTDMLENYEYDEKDNDILCDFSGDCVAKFAEIIEHEGPISVVPIPLKGKFVDQVTEWEAKFFDSMDPKSLLKEFVTICHFYDYATVFNLTCVKIASLIKGKPEQMIEILDLEDDLTDEEKAKIALENSYCVWSDDL